MFEFTLQREMQTFSFNLSLKLSEKRNCLLAVKSFAVNNSVFNKIDENNGFSISIPSCWTPKGGEEKTLNKINGL